MGRINLLWLDDDLRPLSEGMSLERQRLQTWLRYLNTTDRSDRIRVIEVRDLAALRKELERRYQKPEGDPEHIDVFLIDVLWRGTSDESWNFGELDPTFRDERVVPLDAGAQLIGLMRNRRYEGKRPPWLEAYVRHPIGVLTTLVDHLGTVDRHVDGDVLGELKLLIKNSSSTADTPDEAFCHWVAGLSRRNKAAGANVPG